MTLLRSLQCTIHSFLLHSFSVIPFTPSTSISLLFHSLLYSSSHLLSVVHPPFYLAIYFSLFPYLILIFHLPCYCSIYLFFFLCFLHPFHSHLPSSSFNTSCISFLHSFIPIHSHRLHYTPFIHPTLHSFSFPPPLSPPRLNFLLLSLLHSLSLPAFLLSSLPPLSLNPPSLHPSPSPVLCLTDLVTLPYNFPTL